LLNTSKHGLHIGEKNLPSPIHEILLHPTTKAAFNNSKRCKAWPPGENVFMLLTTPYKQMAVREKLNILPQEDSFHTLFRKVKATDEFIRLL